MIRDATVARATTASATARGSLPGTLHAASDGLPSYGATEHGRRRDEYRAATIAYRERVREGADFTQLSETMQRLTRARRLVLPDHRRAVDHELAAP